MKNKEEFQNYYKNTDLKKTIDDFSDYVYELTLHGMWPAYSFAHSVIDDYNLGDSSIMFCLEPDRVKDYVLDQIEAANNTVLFIWGVHITIEFLEWLLTVPEGERDEVGY